MLLCTDKQDASQNHHSSDGIMFNDVPELEERLRTQTLARSVPR